MAKTKKVPPQIFLSILKTRDRSYFEELFNSIKEITGLKIPGKCKFCKKDAWHLFEENVENDEGLLNDEQGKHYLCCDSTECMSRALPELVSKLFGSIQSEVD
ncbi:MAG: hypothetical protein HY226_01230 [Candidatus Vogelbacteria bacterium]|nr:hypothetical protein [Candidatus Vogelbacteria bacterium]